MPRWWGHHGPTTQFGYQANSTSTFAEVGADAAFNQGQRLIIRFPTDIPKGAVVSAASFTADLYVKDSATTQSSVHTIRAHASGDSPKLTSGVNEWRATTTANVSWTASWPGGSSAGARSVSILSIMQELVARSDWVPGGYVTLSIECTNENGSDMGIRGNNPFAVKPRLVVDYTVPVTENRRSQVNLIQNSNFPASLDSSVIDPAATSTPLGTWFQDSYYDSWVGSANYGTVARTVSPEARVSGRNALRFTCGPPPSPNSKGTGVGTFALLDGDRTAVFCGWLYIPSTITSAVRAEFVYTGSGVTIVERDTWVPFCTPVTDFGATGEQQVWPAIKVMPPYTQGWQLYLSEPCVMATDFRQMPWSPLQADTAVIDYIPGASAQQGARLWTPRRNVLISGTPRPRTSWTMHSSGLPMLSEPRKG